MKEYFHILTQTPLFQGMNAEDLGAMLSCLGAELRRVRRGEIVLLAGETPRFVGIVLTGQLHIVREDAAGRRALMAAASSGDVFAEALCCAGVTESPVTVIADADSRLCLLEFARVLRRCPNSCVFHGGLIANMLRLLAGKNLHLQQRMEIICLKTIRSKVLTYLEHLSPSPGQDILIPFNREELADYLSVERSALSHELANMKRDGLIEYHKNRFRLIGGG